MSETCVWIALATHIKVWQAPALSKWPTFLAQSWNASSAALTHACCNALRYRLIRSKYNGWVQTYTCSQGRTSSPFFLRRQEERTEERPGAFRTTSQDWLNEDYTCNSAHWQQCCYCYNLGLIVLFTNPWFWYLINSRDGIYLPDSTD